MEDHLSGTPLCIAAISGNPEILLVMYKNSLVCKGFQDDFPIQFAARSGHHKVVSYLYETTPISKIYTVLLRFGRAFSDL